VILFILYFLVLWLVFAWYNYLFISKKNFHTVGAIVAIYIVLGIILSKSFGLKTYTVYDVLGLSYVALSLRWIFFDIFLNLMLGQKWYYIGTTSWMDRTFQHWQFLLKAIFLFFTIIICLSYCGF
jgi:hypothetical protein